MHEKSVSHTWIQDFFGGGGGWGLPENNPDNCFTVIEKLSLICACPHSSERLILGGGVLIYFYTCEKSQSPLCKKWECCHTKEFSLLLK